jgi:hypothetical protein
MLIARLRRPTDDVQAVRPLKATLRIALNQGGRVQYMKLTVPLIAPPKPAQSYATDVKRLP